MVVLFLAFFVSAVVTFFVIRSGRSHAHLSSDDDMTGPQKFHAVPVPRVGGVGIVAGLVAALLAARLLRAR
jgi:UDP-N-acetylmuramyl pentapeptide phosphotransferase/UDP-N-acetylglucosamine-1-phosphate transferase